MNESVVVLHVQTYELQSIQIVALVLKCVDISFFKAQIKSFSCVRI